MFFINLAAKIIGILHSKGEPKELAWGFALGSIIGLTPLLSLHNLLVALLILLLRVSISTAVFGLTICGLFAYLLDPLFHQLGYLLLVKVQFLQPLWIYLYNVPVAPLTKFYNTVVLGSLVSSLILLAPLYFGFKKLLQVYRAKVAVRIESLHIIKAIKANTFYSWYTKVRSLGVF